MKVLKVLVACEESQRVCIAFRKLGHLAFSCDLISCSGGHPEWHIKQDVLKLLNGNVKFFTLNGVFHFIDKWDLIIAFPPCTYLCASGQSWCNIDKYGLKAVERIKFRDEALNFFRLILSANCDHIAIENPVGVIPFYFRKYDQLIYPYQFGDKAAKPTCLWLKNLPCLTSTNVVSVDYITSKSGRIYDKWFYRSFFISDLKERSKYRSKTFPGIAEAMAFQWSSIF